MKKLRSAFTLAEVLITMAIIGVVAAMTIPTLISKMSQRAAKARQETIEARLLDGINRFSTLEDGLSQHYETTYDFLVGLSKYYKMAQICRANEITNCIPYDKIYYGDEGESVEVSTLTSINSFMSEGSENYLAPASFITAQGTPVVMAFKKDCAWDTGKAMRSISDSGCIAYMYDENGSQAKNKIGSDWQNHGLTVIPPSGEAEPIAIINGVKVMEKAFIPSAGLTKSECEEEISKNYGITECFHDDDRWAYGMKYCHDKGYELPDEDKSAMIVHGLFYNSYTNDLNDYPEGESWDSEKYKLNLNLASNIIGIKCTDGSDLPFKNSPAAFWTNKQDNAHMSYRRYFHTSSINLYSGYRGSSDTFVLCIKN